MQIKVKSDDSKKSEETKLNAHQTHTHAGVSVSQSNKFINTCDGEHESSSHKRWLKLKNDYKKENGFDISKIPEICDNIKFDNLHNPERINEDRLRL